MDALLIIDIQNDYFPKGAAELTGPEAAAGQAALLLDRFRRIGRPVFHVQHLSIREGATFFLPGTPGVDFHASVTPAAGEPVIRKHFPNAFRDTDLEELLRRANVHHLLVAGMMSHMCIDTSVRAAADRGFAVTLAHDACATCPLKFADTTVPAPQVQAAFMAALSGSFARVLATAAILAELPER